MKFLMILIVGVAFIGGCFTWQPKSNESTEMSNLLLDMPKFPKRTIATTVRVPMVDDVGTAFDLFGSDYISIKEIYLSHDEKEIFVFAQLEIKNHQSRPDIPVMTLSSSVPVHAPSDIPVKVYLNSKKHWSMYETFNPGEKKSGEYFYLGQKKLAVIKNETGDKSSEIDRQTPFLKDAKRLYFQQ